MTGIPNKPFSGLERRIAAAVFIGLTALVLATQARNVEFAPNPDGWVSSHGLAIASHADAASGFVGYSLRFVDAAGKPHYEYFDRNPVFFSVALNLLLRQGHTLADKIYIARQAMNVVFLATLAAAFLLVRELAGDSRVAAGAALLTFSGWYLMFYKDMIHFDQPGLFGLVLVLLAIVRYQRTGGRKILYISALAAISFGRGVVALSLLALWAAVDYVTALAAEWANPVSATMRWFKREPVKVFAAAAVLAALYIGYNVAAEAGLCGVAWRDTSIVDSAARRSGLAVAGSEPSSRWGNYLPAVARRIVKSAMPYVFDGATSIKLDRAAFRGAFPFIAGSALLMLGAFLWRLPSADRPLYFLLIFSWVPWFVLMRRHPAPEVHDYTSIYFAGALLAAFAALFGRIRGAIRSAAVALTLAVFVASNMSANAAHSKVSALESYTADFAAILRHVQPGDVIYVDGDRKELIPTRPYALGFYLSGQAIGPAERASYAISRDRNFAPGNLTPENGAVFLFPMQRAAEQSR
ncbi:MAG TPA: hypothetical protein VKH64_01555 [Candidatus Binatia bacterium]|nr:hypothetical protein [Candidatus Binatia bacterium]